MTLAEYLRQPGITASSLADKCECAVSTITRISKGEAQPSADLLRRIYEHTGGAVSPNDLLGIAA